ncbi:glycosyltransferase [Algiphilus sp.]|uniref:glycosyltransferase n=1 Tax=Algiphilus sp. TaxID=1872431 RepID=UPI003C4FF13D
MISVVLPTHNEIGLGLLPDVLAPLTGHADVEPIAVDNASRDGTAALLRDAGARVIDLPGSNRAQRLNAGFAACTGDVVLLHHPRSVLAPDALDALRGLPADAIWGAFTHAFDDRHPLLGWTSWYSNRVRLDRAGVAYLDHCIFLRRDRLPDAPVPDLDIFEDTALSRRLRPLGRPRRLPQIATTSAVRYRRNGVWRQAAMNQVLKLGYAARVPPRLMNRIYERGLSLNG